MTSPSPERLRLVPDRGVELLDGQTVATASAAWLRIEPGAEFLRHRWIELRYSSSLFDEPVRPLIRFVTAKGETIIQPMNGPVLGSAHWIGRIPDHTVSAAISPRAAAPCRRRTPPPHSPRLFRVDR